MSSHHDNPLLGPTSTHASSTVAQALDFTRQAEKLSLEPPDHGSTDVAVEARFITPLDPVIVTSEGHRLPNVPVKEAHKLNLLKEQLDQDHDSPHGAPNKTIKSPSVQSPNSFRRYSEGTLHKSIPPTHTNPLFPPLPLYGPSSLARDIHCATFRMSSFFLSMGFLGAIVLGSLFTSIPTLFSRAWLRMTFRNPDSDRPFHEEEVKRAAERKVKDRNWKRRHSQGRVPVYDDKPLLPDTDGFVPTEGGPDPITCDPGYYARRVGLDIEEFEVQTEDGFIIDLWHVYDPREYDALSEEDRSTRGPDLFTGDIRSGKKLKDPSAPRKYPVLLIHGLLQSAGAYCVNDEQSLAFWLCKSGYDVWLGNNRCGFKPKHVLLDYSDPRMWCWNIRQMGVFDLPALTSRVLYETGFAKCGLIAHSQGTTETFVALAKEQRPDLGEKFSVFCALAPAAYAGPLIGKMYFKFMQVITPGMFRLMFGIHSFIPIMMTMHGILPGRLYGWLGYKVFSFLFDWSDSRWDRGLRDRLFQFAPVYVSSESMRWWLGRECFAKHKCILATKEEWRAEEREDADESQSLLHSSPSDRRHSQSSATSGLRRPHKHSKGARAWYNSQSPPFALWVAGHDNLVDGDKMLRRFEKGREPNARLIHKKVIPDYEHLDVIWAMDAETQIYREVREVLWRTVPAEERGRCRVPVGCENVVPWVDDRKRGWGGIGDEDDEILGEGSDLVDESGTGSSSEDVSSSS